MTEWFRRKSKNIKTFDKRDTKAGEWQKCPECNEFIYKTVLKTNYYVCPNCTYHYRLNCDEYIKLLIDCKSIMISNLSFINIIIIFTR